MRPRCIFGERFRAKCSRQQELPLLQLSRPVPDPAKALGKNYGVAVPASLLKPMAKLRRGNHLVFQRMVNRAERLAVVQMKPITEVSV
jgi:hypothetical protein